MTIRRDVPSLPGTERQTHRRGPAGGSVNHLAVHPSVVSLHDFDTRARRLALEFLTHDCLGEIEFILRACLSVTQQERGIIIG